MKRLMMISASAMLVSSAFAQQKCVTAPVNVTGNQVTITTSGDKAVTKEKVYIYYAKRHHHGHMQAYPVAGITDKYPSAPIKLSEEKDANPVSETYEVSLTTPQSNVSVCPDSTLDVTANIKVERVSAYTGNYPGSTTENSVYNKVSKHHYKAVARKMRKIKRNEEKVARKTGMKVEARVDRA